MTQEPTKPRLPDAYFDLGLSSTASTTEVKTAYRKLALVYHPDKKAPGETIDAADFRQINEAFEVLRDEDTKARYDQAYPRVEKEWVAYREEDVEFQQNPEAWRRKKAADTQSRAQAAAEQRRQTEAQYTYDDSDDYNHDDDDDEVDREDYESGGRYHFGGHSRGGRPSQEERFNEDWLKRFFRGMREEDEARWAIQNDLHKANVAQARTKMAREHANQRAIEQQKKVTEALREKADGIRIVGLEAKLAMAQKWVEGLQSRYAQELKAIREHLNSGESIDLGWERKKGRQICHFCDTRVHEYSFRCPSGGAVACRGCKIKIASSSPSQPFTFENNGSGVKKGKGKKGKGKKKAKQSRAMAEEELNSEEPESGEQDAEEDEADMEETQEQEAREQEACDLAAEEEREARQDAALEAQEKVVQEAAEKVAQEKTAADNDARELAARKKEVRKKEAREKEAQKKAARKKAAKEKVALARATQEKAAQEKAAQEKAAQEEEEEAVQRRKAQEEGEEEEARTRAAKEKEAQEREALEAFKNAARKLQGNTARAEQQAQEAKAAAATRNIPARNIVHPGKKPTKKPARPPPVCFFCNEEGHIARKCPKKRAHTTNGVNGAIENPSTATVASAPSTDNTTESTQQEPIQSIFDVLAKKVGLPARLKSEHSSNGVNVEPPMSDTWAWTAQDASTFQTPVPSVKEPTKNSSRPARPALICCGCKADGHIARHCPVRTQKAKTSKAKTPPLGLMAEVSITVEPTPAPAANPSEVSMQGKDRKKKARKSKPTKKTQEQVVDRTNILPSKLTAETPVSSATNRPSAPLYEPAEGETVKLTMKPLRAGRPRNSAVCYACNEEGHIARNCPTIATAPGQENEKLKTKPRALFARNKVPRSAFEP